MNQIHMKPEAVLLSGFGFRLGCLQFVLRSVLNPIQSLINQFKKYKVFFHAKGKQLVELSRQSFVCHLAGNEALKLFFELVL